MTKRSEHGIQLAYEKNLNGYQTHAISGEKNECQGDQMSLWKKSPKM
jgi:hypothetical protein